MTIDVSGTCLSTASNVVGSGNSAINDTIVFVILCMFALPTIIWLILYLIPQIYMGWFSAIPNLKQKYNNCQWALVTGAGSGIGKAIVFKLASQNINVVLVSLDDTYLKQTFNELKEQYPLVQFRSVGVTFAPGIDYMDSITKAVVDIQDDITIVFCNAGYMVTGFFDQTPINKILSNIECNTTSAVSVAHLFIQRMVQNKRKGCIVFTSSVAGFIPTPFATMYASTKAFISQLAASLHIELTPIGIDVLAVHPSPVETNFYMKLEHKVDMIEAATKQAVTPDIVCDAIFRSIGNCALRDIGGLALGTRIGTFFLPYNFFAEMFTFAAPFLPDWKNHSKNRK